MMMEMRFEAPSKFETAVDELHEIAAGEAGTDDFGGDDYRMGLRVLLQSMDYDPRFSEIGRKLAWGQVITVLTSRLRAVAGMKAIPDLESLEIRAPVVITGIPRTGTTALHRLLAVDPQFQGIQTWLVDGPMPRPRRETWEAHPLFQRQVKSLEARFAATPHLRAAHNMFADEVEECLFILCHSFTSNLWACSGWSAPTYDAWWQAESEAVSYRYYKRVLQMIGSTEPQKRWLLKNPGHIDNLDLLFAVFPDARVIQTHRDPAKGVPSLCALLMQGAGLMETTDMTLRAHILGHRETVKWANALRRAEPHRQAHADQIMDVRHADFHADPLGVVRRIYAFAGMQLSPDVEAAMGERVQAKPELAYGAHRYDIADFGLTAGEVRERYGDYVKRFDLV
jgi:hypothetical protein